MKKRQIFLTLAAAVFILAACQSKKIALISKKWNYVKIENVDSVDKKYMSPEDSTNNANMEKAMSMLNWTFNKDKTYTCKVGNRIATSGTYEITDDDRSLEMTPSSKMVTTTYIIKTLTENELILASTVNTVIVTMYFTAEN